MVEGGGGSIVGAPGRFADGTAEIGLTKSVAAEYITEGLRCNAIFPATVESPSLEQRLAATDDYDKARSEFVARQPMGRIGLPGEIATLAVYLEMGDRMWLGIDNGESSLIVMGCSLTRSSTRKGRTSLTINERGSTHH